MSERCPLRAGGFYADGQIPEVCRQSCEVLWDTAIKLGQSDHEEYPDYILSEEADDCTHYSTELGTESLQANPNNSGERFYGLTEMCVSCEEEIAEDSHKFICPNNQHS